MSTLDKKSDPIPQGKYVPASRFGDIIYTAGMTPRKNGRLIQSGKVNSDVQISDYKTAVRQATDNAITAAVNLLSEDEALNQILSVTVYVNADESFQAHSLIADLASEYLYEKLGNAGMGARAAIGVASLPGNAPVEIQLIAGISPEM